MGFFDDVGGFFGRIGSGISDAAGTIGSFGKDIGNFVGNNPMLADALPMIGMLTPQGRRALGNMAIGAGSGFMTGGPVGAIMGGGQAAIGDQIQGRSDPLTWRSALTQALRGAGSGMANPAMTAFKFANSAANQQNRRSMLANALKQRAMMQAMQSRNISNQSPRMPQSINPGISQRLAPILSNMKRTLDSWGTMQDVASAVNAGYWRDASGAWHPGASPRNPYDASSFLPSGITGQGLSQLQGLYNKLLSKTSAPASFQQSSGVRSFDPSSNTVTVNFDAIPQAKDVYATDMFGRRVTPL